jgi:predicted transcriptional regulator
MSGMIVDMSLVEIAKEVTIAWLSNPNTRTDADDVPAFFKEIYETIAALVDDKGKPVEPEAVVRKYTPAVTARKSLASPEHIISMIDGKPYRTLRRHLATNGIAPAEYCERYGLKADYPMVAPAYSEARRVMAARIGLGQKLRQSAMKADAKPTRGPRKRRAEEVAT